MLTQSQQGGYLPNFAPPCNFASKHSFPLDDFPRCKGTLNLSELFSFTLFYGVIKIFFFLKSPPKIINTNPTTMLSVVNGLKRKRYGWGVGGDRAIYQLTYQLILYNHRSILIYVLPEGLIFLSNFLKTSNLTLKYFLLSIGKYKNLVLILSPNSIYEIIITDNNS